MPGVFHDSGHTGLLFYDQQNAVAVIFDTDGAGDLVYPGREYSGWRPSWTHITTVRVMWKSPVPLAGGSDVGPVRPGGLGRAAA